MSSSQGKILVIRGGAIGDFILTLPVIAALRQQFPRAHLEVLGYPHIVQLAVEGGLVNRVQPIEARALAGFFARNGQLSEDLADYFSEFDLILSYLYDPDEIFKNNVGRCTGAQFIAGPHRPDETQDLHATKVYLKPLERLAIFDADHVPRLCFEPQFIPGRQPECQAGALKLRSSGIPSYNGSDSAPVLNQLALHPGSGSERKNWPEVRWAELVERLLHSTEFDLLLVGGEAEGQRLQRLAAPLPTRRVAFAQSLPLGELGRRLQRCSAFIGHDSGISHLAAAVGLPGVILWEDTAEAIWRPQSQKMVVLRHPAGLANLTVNQVFEALDGLAHVCI